MREPRSAATAPGPLRVSGWVAEWRVLNVSGGTDSRQANAEIGGGRGEEEAQEAGRAQGTESRAPPRPRASARPNGPCSARLVGGGGLDRARCPSPVSPEKTRPGPRNRVPQRWGRHSKGPAKRQLRPAPPTPFLVHVGDEVAASHSVGRQARLIHRRGPKWLPRIARKSYRLADLLGLPRVRTTR